MKNPLLPLKYAGLGLKLIKKGKVAIQLPTKKPASLDRIFKKTKELETGS
jgi:heterodisulfide reductase subunit C